MTRVKQLLILIRRRSRFASLQALPFRCPNTISHSCPSAAPSRRFCSDDTAHLRDRIVLLSESPSSLPADGMKTLRSAVTPLAEELLALPSDRSVADYLDSSCFGDLLRRPPAGYAGFACVELLSCLQSYPLLALQVFEWRRKQAGGETPILPEEYSKAIALAGRAKNVNHAYELFTGALAAGIHETSVYNALMSAYMMNALIKKAISLFEGLKVETRCKPNIVSYNILLSVFGRSMLVDHMEAVLRALDDSQLSYTITTYNMAIAGYITAWRWDKAEKMYQSMLNGPIKPDINTLLLMLRGYAYSVDIEKMEKIYDQIKETVINGHAWSLRAMVCAYSKSSCPDRITKVETLMKLIPEDGYRPWVNVLLIRMYAEEGLVDAMEGLISEALQRNTTVITVGVMRSIISSYFRISAVDKLADFIRQAEDAGWRICRSLYHCKMVLYGQQNRFGEMHGVLDEMDNLKFSRTKKTFWIMYKAYHNIGRIPEAETIAGMMWKHGFFGPEDSLTL